MSNKLKDQINKLFENNEWRINTYCAYHNLKIKVLLDDNGDLLLEKYTKVGKNENKTIVNICLYSFVGEELPNKYEIMPFLAFVDLVKSKGFTSIKYYNASDDWYWHIDAVPAFTKDFLDKTLSDNTLKNHDELNKKYDFLKESLYSISEEEVTDYVVDYLINKSGQKWSFDKLKKHVKRQHGADIDIRGNEKGTRRFIIECKGKSTAKTQQARSSVDKEGWLVALGQVITRMTSKRIVENGVTKSRVAKGTCYGLALYWKGAETALKRINVNISDALNLYIFSIDDNGVVKMFTPKKRLSKPKNNQNPH